MNDETERMKKKSLLLSYYAQNGNNSTNIDTISLATTGSSSSLNPINISTNITTASIRDPYDINSTSFEPDLYLKKLIKVNILL
jgi:hypothetical protein